MLASSASLRKSLSTPSATEAAVVFWAAAMALMVRPSATIRSSASSAADRPPGSVTGFIIASTIRGSRTEPPVVTSRTARTSWSPSATRSLSR